LKNVRVRFAPSPTGYLHVGGARTAIFNWLFARKQGGQFLLRIEDTDVARSGEEMVEAIIKGMQWLGLNWDEEIVYQSARLEVYKTQAAQLIADGKAYKCFCSKEELESKRQNAAKEKRDYKYKHERMCLNRKREEIEAFEKEGRPFVVRFKLPEGETVFSDQVYGEIRVNHAQLDDFIIQRSDGYPTYHLAVVVDDHEMAISHIIRGDDHLSNTPKHLLLFQAFGWICPIFAHVPLILGPDKQRLSKRHGATAVGEYEKWGYLAEAFLNFLSLLGWSSGDDRELFGREELIQEFDLSGIQKKSAVFDEKKLEWLNGQYLMTLDDRKLLELVSPRLLKAGLVTDDTLFKDKEDLLKIIALLKPRLKRLSEISDMSRYFFRDPETYAEKAVKKHWSSPDVIEQLTNLKDQLAGVSDFNEESIEGVIRGLAEKLNKGAGKIIHPLRLALTGVSFSPGIFEVMELLGKETVINRLKTAIHFLESHAIEHAEA